jgi:baculoviral IAP repeat-containing protein 6
MKPLQFIINEISPNHKFYNKINTKPEPSAMKRIISEISSFKSGLPLNYESSIWIRISKTNMSLFTFLISGPKDTPYENGLFLFNAYLPHNYPQKEPNVLLVTTGNGSVRFNPNLYNSGKVCLSLLGTWAGQESEKWNSKNSTFLQVLISIQSLILIDEPYFNEPGYEREMNTNVGKQSSKSYNNNIQYENIRWAMIDQIKNPPSGYEDVIKNHFKLKKNDIINKVNKWMEELDEVSNINKNKLIKDNMIKEITILTELLNNL